MIIWKIAFHLNSDENLPQTFEENLSLEYDEITLQQRLNRCLSVIVVLVNRAR